MFFYEKITWIPTRVGATMATHGKGGQITNGRHTFAFSVWPNNYEDKFRAHASECLYR